MPGQDDATASERPYERLTPERIMDAVESTGRRCDGRLLALNSFENRVYQVGIEDGDPVIAKFYRPGRWSDAAILEEHAFCAELAEREVPVVAPLDLGGTTLVHTQGYRLALFPRRPGRAPELDDPETLAWMGRFVARIHAVGELRRFAHRPAVDPESYGQASIDALLDGDQVPPHLAEAWSAAAHMALERVRARYADAGRVRTLRLHADCHAGNVLWTPDGPHFVDFDDCRSGPAVQDLWMLLSGDRPSMARQLGHVLEGYRRFRDFDVAELWLVEPLRTLRMLHHSAWIAARWADPAFPASFTWFGTDRYWQEQILGLKEQVAAMDEPPLEVD